MQPNQSLRSSTQIIKTLGCCGLVRMGCCCLDGLCHGFLMDVVSRIYDIFDHIGLVFERFGVFLKVFLINGGRDDC